MTPRAKLMFWTTVFVLVVMALVQAWGAFRWARSPWLGMTLVRDGFLSFRYEEEVQPALLPLLNDAPLQALAIEVGGEWSPLYTPGSTPNQPFERLRTATLELPEGKTVHLRLRDAAGSVSDVPLQVARVPDAYLLERWGVYTILGVLLSAFGLWVYYRRPDSAEARAFAFATLCWSIGALVGQVSGGYPTQFHLVDLVARYCASAAFPLVALTIAPRPWFKSRPWVVWLPWLLPVIAVLHACIAASVDPLFIENLSIRIIGAGGYFFFFSYLLWARLRTSSRQEKRRLELYLVSIPAGFLMPLLRFYIWVEPGPTYEQFSTLIMPAVIGYGILKHRLFDIEVAIRRSLGYAALGAAAIAVYAVLASVARVVMGSWEAARSAPVTAVFVSIALVVGGAVRPRLQRVVDRGVNPERFLHLEALRRASAELALVSEESRAADSLVRAATGLAGLSGAALYLERKGRYQMAARSGRIADPTGAVMERDEPLIGLARLVTSEIHRDDFEQNPRLASVKQACTERMETLGAEMLLPLRLSEGSLLGFLALGPRADARPLNSEDLEMLKMLSREAALAVERSRSRPESQPTARLGSGPVRLGTGVQLGRYRMKELLGRGGMGDVYLAVDENLHREVALKFIREGQGEGATPNWLRREARVLASLSHPNIMQIFALEEEGGHTFLVAERLEGPPLDEELEARGPYSIEETIRIGMQVAEALGYAWDKGVIHRDVKPANIMRAGPDTVKLTDFGLARPHERGHSLTGGGGILGTPTYLAPELFGGERASYRTDMYALGMVLHVLRTGEPVRGMDGSLPWYGTGGEPDLSRLEDGVEIEALAQAVARLIQKRPEDRFPDYTALIAYLRGQV